MTLSGPRENLVKVRNLTSVETDNSKYNITWVKPLFIHSAVLQYAISYELTNHEIVRKRRETKEAILMNVTTVIDLIIDYCLLLYIAQISRFFFLMSFTTINYIRVNISRFLIIFLLDFL